MYTLIVTGAAAERDHGVFRMDTTRFLEFTDEAIVAQLTPILTEGVERLRTWPCILMDEGRSDERVRLGRITGVSLGNREISLAFEPTSLGAPLPLTNDDIWKLRGALDIEEFEFSRNHVAVKDRDAIGVLEGAGHDVGDAARVHFKATELQTPDLTQTPSRPPRTSTTSSAPKSSRSPNRVFIVHGRNEAARSSVVNHLRDLGLNPIVLHDQPNMGRHLLTKFIEEAELVTFAVVVMTDDDVGGVNERDLAPRARQNVILELGYFIAHLGQDRVCALITPGLETPSDFDGIVYIRMDSGDGWRRELARELRAAKMPIPSSVDDGTT